MLATVTGGESPSQTEETDDGGTEDDATSSEDEAAGSDGHIIGEGGEEATACPSLRMDHRHQRTLFQVGDEEEVEEAASDAQSLSQNLRKFVGDLCGWVPNPSVQYRRQAAEKPPPKAGARTNSKLEAGSASRRPVLNRNLYGQTNHQQTASHADFEFKHFSNYKKYSEQYRRFHTCGGPLQKLTQSAYGGRPRTIYYAGDATTEAGVDVNATTTSHQARPGPGMGGAAVRGPRITEKPNSNSQPIISYSDISVNSPRFNLFVDNSHRKNRVHQYPRMEWTHQPDGFDPHASGADRPTTGNPPPGGWNVSMNDQTLTVYTSKPPGTLPPSGRSDSPPKPHLPFFPSQQPLRQLHTTRTTSLTPPVPGSKPTNDPLPNGYSLDRSLGSQGGCSTGISRNPLPHRDFYSQLMHAAHCLSLAAKSPKDFDFQLPHWPTYTSHSEIQKGTSSQQHTSRQEKTVKNSPPPSSSTSNNVQVHMKGRGISASPTLNHQPSKFSSKSSKQQHANIRKVVSTHLENPTSATNCKETHYITIEAPTCSPFDSRSSLHSKGDSEKGVQQKTSYRVTLKEKPVVSDLKDKTSMDMVADANRPLAVCEVAWF